MTLTVTKMILFLNFVTFFMGNVIAEDKDFAKLFRSRNAKGTLVVSSLDGKTEYLYNKKRAEKRFLPASTFKIPNTLIALDEKAIGGDKEIIKWNGKDRGWKVWNKDHSLETAFPVSCVWFYQELARRVGNDKYLSHLKKIKYGNQKTGRDVTTFWLDGDLKISAQEQIAFLKKLYHNKLPYKKQHIELLKKIMVAHKTPECVIRAKTGWVMRQKKQYGWYVGYAEKKNGEVWFFAINIDINQKRDAAYRKEIVMEALKIKGIM